MGDSIIDDYCKVHCKPTLLLANWRIHRFVDVRELLVGRFEA